MTGVCLKDLPEGFQSGLSWLTILNKREGFRAAFAQFDAEQVAAFDQADVGGWCRTPPSCATGARSSPPSTTPAVLELRREFGSLARYVWQYEAGAADRPAVLTLEAAAHAHVHRGVGGLVQRPEKSAAGAL